MTSPFNCTLHFLGGTAWLNSADTDLSSKDSLPTTGLNASATLSELDRAEGNNEADPPWVYKVRTDDSKKKSNTVGRNGIVTSIKTNAPFLIPPLSIRSSLDSQSNTRCWCERLGRDCRLCWSSLSTSVLVTERIGHSRARRVLDPLDPQTS